jgi:zinc transport system substrate-binding protein
MRALLVLTFALVLALPSGGTRGATGEKVAVVASFYPMYEFARQVGGDRVTVRNLTPAGAEPHDYELTPRDVVAVNKARLLIYNGAGLEPWVQKLLPQLPAQVIKVNAAEGIQLSTVTSGEDRGRVDPHIWLDPVLAQRQIDNIAAGLGRADPDGKTVYEANALQFKQKLAELHDRITKTFGPCRKKVFVANHAAFGYFAARYGLTQIAIAGLAPEAEPSAAKIREILQLIRQHGLRVIYYETLASPRVATMIAREVGARILVLNPLEGLTDEEIKQGKGYLSVMGTNIRSLAQGFDCP